MSLNIYLTAVRPTEVFAENITHNLTEMARNAGLYIYIWRADEFGITNAAELVEPLSKGLELLKSDPERFKKFNPSNGWGCYEDFVEFVERYLNACRDNQDATLEVSG